MKPKYSDQIRIISKRLGAAKTHRDARLEKIQSHKLQKFEQKIGNKVLVRWIK